MANEPGQKFRILQLIYGALFASLFFYTGIVFFISNSWDPATARGFGEIEFLVLTFMAVSCAAAIPIVKKVLLKKVQTDSDVTVRIQILLSAHIVTFAMAEFVVFLGIAATFLLKNRTALFPFLGLAILLFLLHAPKRAAFDKM